jgi:hypothetical protein
MTSNQILNDHQSQKLRGRSKPVMNSISYRTLNCSPCPWVPPSRPGDKYQHRRPSLRFFQYSQYRSFHWPNAAQHERANFSHCMNIREDYGPFFEIFTQDAIPSKTLVRNSIRPSLILHAWLGRDEKHNNAFSFNWTFHLSQSHLSCFKDEIYAWHCSRDDSLSEIRTNDETISFIPGWLQSQWLCPGSETDREWILLHQNDASNNQLHCFSNCVPPAASEMATCMIMIA